jgi:hypothetical protein
MSDLSNRVHQFGGTSPLFQHWSFLESGDVGGLTYHHLSESTRVFMLDLQTGVEEGCFWHSSTLFGMPKIYLSCDSLMLLL